MLFVLLTIIHVLVCVFLIIVVLLQSGKAADLAGAFGGMGSQTAFGPRGSATLLSKATTHFGGPVHGDVAVAVDSGDAERRVGRRQYGSGQGQTRARCGSGKDGSDCSGRSGTRSTAAPGGVAPSVSLTRTVRANRRRHHMPVNQQPKATPPQAPPAQSQPKKK